MSAENESRTRAEADRRAAELDYFETQQDFSEILQVTRREPEAHDLIKRHLERSLPGATVAVFSRNNSDDRFEVMTELAERLTADGRARRRRARVVRGDPAWSRPHAQRGAQSAARVRDLRRVAWCVALHALVGRR